MMKLKGRWRAGTSAFIAFIMATNMCVAASAFDPSDMMEDDYSDDVSEEEPAEAQEPDPAVLSLTTVGSSASDVHCYPRYVDVEDITLTLTGASGTYYGVLENYLATDRTYTFVSSGGDVLTVPDSTMTLEIQTCINDFDLPGASYEFFNTQTGEHSKSITLSLSDWSKPDFVDFMNYVAVKQASLAPSGLCSIMVLENTPDVGLEAFRDRAENAMDSITDASITVAGNTTQGVVDTGAIWFTVPTKWDASTKSFDFSNVIDVQVFGVATYPTTDYFEGRDVIKVPASGLCADFDIYSGPADFNIDFGNYMYERDSEEEDQTRDTDVALEGETVGDLTLDTALDLDAELEEADDIDTAFEGMDTKQDTDPNNNPNPNEGNETIKTFDSKITAHITANFDSYVLKYGTVNTLVSVVDKTTNKTVGKFDIAGAENQELSVPAGNYKLVADATLDVSFSGTLTCSATSPASIDIKAAPHYVLKLTTNDDIVSCTVAGNILRGEKLYNVVLTPDKEYVISDLLSENVYTVTLTKETPKMELILGSKGPTAIKPDENSGGEAAIIEDKDETDNTQTNTVPDAPLTAEQPLNGFGIAGIIVIILLGASLVPVYIINKKRK